MKTKPLTFLLVLTFLFLFNTTAITEVSGETGDYKIKFIEHEQLKILAEQGDAKAQFELGDRYRFGLRVPKDGQEAVKWYKLAAEQGNAKAQFNLGRMYQDGEGVPQYYKEAVKWYKLAAEQGNAKAQFNLGDMYRDILGLQDSKEAVKWWKLAAEQGDAKAQFELGFAYYKGRGVLQDYVLAHMWLNLAGSNSHGGAVANRKILEAQMTPSKIEKAQEMANNWKPKQ